MSSSSSSVASPSSSSSSIVSLSSLIDVPCLHLIDRPALPFALILTSMACPHLINSPLPFPFPSTYPHLRLWLTFYLWLCLFSILPPHPPYSCPKPHMKQSEGIHHRVSAIFELTRTTEASEDESDESDMVASVERCRVRLAATGLFLLCDRQPICGGLPL